MTTQPSAPDVAQELQPCPFCGHGDSLIEYHDPQTILHPWYRIECDYCGAKGPGSDRGDHKDQWNRQAARAPAVRPEPETMTCERCGMPPEHHDYRHWCDNQSFRIEAPQPAPAVQPDDEPSRCGLTECQGKPRCKTCKASGADGGPAVRQPAAPEIAELRAALRGLYRRFGDPGSRDVDVIDWNNRVGRAIAAIDAATPPTQPNGAQEGGK